MEQTSKSILEEEKKRVMDDISKMLDSIIDLSEELYAMEIYKDDLCGVDAIGMTRGATVLLSKISEVYDSAICRATKP